MHVAATPRLMTTEEFLALPDDGVERWLINGQLRERSMTYRNRWHSRTLTCVAYVLESWLRQQPEPRGLVLSGDAGFRLRRDPDSVVGIDVAYISAEIASHEFQETTLIEGVPVLAIEILSPSNTVEDIDEKLDSYLQAGVPLVWLIDPHFRTVTIYRPGQPPEMVNVHQEISADPHLPGFRVPVAQLFA